jgi:hypothetical protein
MIDYIWMIHLALLCSLSVVLFILISYTTASQVLKTERVGVKCLVVVLIVGVSTGLASITTDLILIQLFIK